ncbi:cation diffusion facilitator family transporter [Pontibacter harenae]|uniref:cation diffusion facilitator family transporter n=1 Tax=Pontibacter harenae TaxID=2894083 RepID=UPI001E358BA5|nr:cation diffusion facilitator family transporter [Pontibacter harenae]MCC9166832.1 cation diffusion facilitator family transporter [Pontibacter harenae]
MAHEHHKHEGHGHHHHASDNIKVAFFLNLSFTIIEVIGGLYINSVAILSDALHDLGDSLSLGLAWYFENLSKRGRDQNYSYGYKRFSLLGAVINSVILLVGSVVILTEAIPRLWDPQSVNAPGMMGLAVLGIIVNGAAVLRLQGGASLNERVVRLHLLEDVLGWVAVLVGGIIIYFFDIPIVDPLLSIGITLFVVYNVFRNLGQSLKILLQGTPSQLDIQDIQTKLEKLPPIRSVHDLHVWSLDGTNHILTLHAVVDANLQMQEAEQIKQQVRAAMANMEIKHVTVELEMPGQECRHQDCST